VATGDYEVFWLLRGGFLLVGDTGFKPVTSSVSTLLRYQALLVTRMIIQATDVRKMASEYMWQRYSASLYQAFLVRTDPRVPNGGTPSGVTNVSWPVAPCRSALPYRPLA